MLKLETVSTSQIVAELAERFEDIPKKMVKEIVADFLTTIENEVVNGKKVRVDHVGIILAKDRAARKGRNPQTGEALEIPASKKISFRASKSLKEKAVGATKVKKKK